MKKLRLKALEIEGAEILTREQLKKVLGGGTGGTTEPFMTTIPEDCRLDGCPESEVCNFNTGTGGYICDIDYEGNGVGSTGRYANNCSECTTGETCLGAPTSGSSGGVYCVNYHP